MNTKREFQFSCGVACWTFAEKHRSFTKHKKASANDSQTALDGILDRLVVPRSKPRDPTFPLTLCLRGGDLETDVLVCKASREIDQGNDINLGAAGLLVANIATTNPVP